MGEVGNRMWNSEGKDLKKFCSKHPRAECWGLGNNLSQKRLDRPYGATLCMCLRPRAGWVPGARSPRQLAWGQLDTPVNLENVRSDILDTNQGNRKRTSDRTFVSPLCCLSTVTSILWEHQGSKRTLNG